jgi:hypothetical protein
VDVDKAGARLPVPIPREDTSDNSDDPSIIDRDKLAAGGPLSLIILTSDSRFRVGDTIEATYTTKVAGQQEVVYIVSGIVAGDFGQTVPCVLQIPNEQVVSGSTAHMAYRLLRDNVVVGTSRTAVATVIGQGEPVPDEKPVITNLVDSNNQQIPPDGSTYSTQVTVSGTASMDENVQVFDHSASQGSVVVNGDGQWTLPLRGLIVGNHRLTAKALYGTGKVSEPRAFNVEVVPVLAAPSVKEADPLTNTLNLIKPVNGVTVVVPQYPGMAVGDQVTLHWEGTAGAGSATQTKSVATSGPLEFGIANTTITPNHNRTVRIRYTVDRLGDVPSDTRQMLIQHWVLTGTATFETGTTSYYRCAPSVSEVMVPESLPIGAVITESRIADISALTLVVINADSHKFAINNIGPQPRDDGTIFPTRIPGVGARMLYHTPDQIRYLYSGPRYLPPGRFQNGGTRGSIQFVKTGNMQSGTIPAGVIAEWRIAANRLYMMGFELTGSLRISLGGVAALSGDAGSESQISQVEASPSLLDELYLPPAP